MVNAPSDGAESAYERELRELNAALLVSSLHQHELTEQARLAEAESRKGEEVAVLARHAIEQAYLALRASEERYRGLFNSIDEGFCVVEMLFDTEDNPLDYRFLETNPAFEKQSGLQNVIGKRARTLVPQYEDRWVERYGRVALTGESTRFIDQAQAPSGRWFDVYAFRLGAQEGRRVAILFADITERRSLEEKAREQARSLAELNSRKDDFLAMLSHELRNPLAAMSNAADLLRLPSDGHSLRLEAQEMIDRQVVYLTRIVDELLDMARISTGRIRLQVGRVDMRAVIRHAVQAMQPHIDKKGQSLRQYLPAEPLYVEGDATRLEQVIVNLLDNANKYTDDRGQIGVTLQQESNEVVLRVQDNGVGITPELLPHIFDLFTQAEQPLDRARGGLGIGLALVRSLVTLQGGRVEARSTHRDGSEFVVRLPMLSSSIESAEVAPEIAPTPAHTLKVLLVEDNVDVAKGVGRLLRASGHETLVVNDGASATKVAPEFVPDVAILDVGLPIIDGFQLARWFRGEPALGKVVLVALTGYGRDSDKQLAASAGFDFHLVKPVPFTEIKKILAIAAEKKQTEGV